MIQEEKERIKRLKKLKELGIDPYPSFTSRSHVCKEVKDNFNKLLKKNISLAGRLRLIRYHGKLTFVQIEDETGKLQICLRQDVLGNEKYKIFKTLIDIGDFLQVEGELFKTKKGEKTLLVKKYVLLAKALLPLPEKWHGLANVELRFRKRYLDLIANPEIKKIFEKRSLIIKLIRKFFNERGFIEVETPILQPIPGGANARPFVTHHNALDIDLYLRIAPELYLKRLIIGGFGKVYEIARCFRNEGIDYAHNPEFTQVEFYQAYTDYKQLMKLTEEFMQFILENVEGKREINYQGKKINFTPPYPKITFRDALIKFAQIDIEKEKTKEKLLKIAQKRNLEVNQNWGKGKILDEIYKELVRPKIIQPTFLIDHPVELSPLAKRKKDNPDYVERFQLIVSGLEICNAFSELNDPLDQEERFKEQQKLKELGDQEAQSFDEDFIEALKYGMPPTAGEGIGIDRLVAILSNVHNIKEVILFPTMRPKIKKKKSK